MFKYGHHTSIHEIMTVSRYFYSVKISKIHIPDYKNKIYSARWWIFSAGSMITLGIVGYRYESDILWANEALLRAIRTIQTAIIMVLDYKFSLWNASKLYQQTVYHRSGSKDHNDIQSNDQETIAYQAEKSAVHQRCANRLLGLFSTNGGVYIKLGQYIASLDHILPSEYCKTMSILQNEAPIRSTLSDIASIWKEEFSGVSIDEVFDYIDPIPSGTASLAQVHKAHLRTPITINRYHYYNDSIEKKNYEWVAIKIQHPNVRSHADMDMWIVSCAIKTVKWLFPEFEFGWLADEMRKNLPKELDFVLEGKNSERLTNFFIKDSDQTYYQFVHVPTILWHWTTSKVLTMEYISQGGRIDDLSYMKSNNISPNKVYKLLNQVFSRMIFHYGFVHCDPHPGNLQVRPLSQSNRNTLWCWILNYTLIGRIFQYNNPFELIILDHGLYQELDLSFRHDYASIWMALLTRNEDDIKYYSNRLGGGDAYRLFSCILTHRSWRTIASGDMKQQWMETPEEVATIMQKATQYMSRVVILLSRLPRQLLLLFKINDLLRHIGRSLGQHASSEMFRITWRSCMQFLRYEYPMMHGEQNRGILRSLSSNIYYYFQYLRIEIQLFILELF